MRNSRPTHVVAGAVMLAIPGSAVALAAGQADAQSAVQIKVSSRHLAAPLNSQAGSRMLQLRGTWIA